MYIVHVHIHVKTECLDDFKKISLENARSSLDEPGVARFDLLQETGDPTRFVLVEVYRSSADQVKHKETVHYNRWRLAAEPMMAEPRSRVVYANIFPSDQDY